MSTLFHRRRRPRVPNFHDARLSVAQSAIRELVAKADPGRKDQGGLFADHPVVQAVGSVFRRIYSGELADAPSSIAAYRQERAAQGPLGELGETFGDCMDLVAEYVVAWLHDDQDALAEIASEFKYNKCDLLGWASAVVAWLGYYWDGRAPRYAPPPAQPIALPAEKDGVVTVGILGDWGTGEPEALAVLDRLMGQAPDLVVHVGDIYYAGTHDECTTNFLDPVKAARAAHGLNIPFYVLPGNHDYYSGGAGFYAMLPQLNLAVPHGWAQTNSFFSLYNDTWQLEGMDTGYNDHDLVKVADDITRLVPEEEEWHAQQLAAAASAGRTVILLSHHQLFSAFETIGTAVDGVPQYQNPYLTTSLATWRQQSPQPQMPAWLWGHEHLLEVYATPDPPQATLPVAGRCVGNGAFPIFNDEGAYTPSPQSPIPLQNVEGFPGGIVQTGNDGEVYANGYAVLTLGATEAVITYYQVNFTGSVTGATSVPLWSETLATAQQKSQYTS